MICDDGERYWERAGFLPWDNAQHDLSQNSQIYDGSSEAQLIYSLAPLYLSFPAFSSWDPLLVISHH